MGKKFNRQFDVCNGCFGYCCITSMGLPVTFITDDDIIRISKYLDVPEPQFRERYVATTFEGMPLQHWKFQPGPCLWWQNGLCTIQKVKPQSCKREEPLAKSMGVDCKMWNKMRALGV